MREPDVEVKELRVAIANTPGNEAAPYFVTRQDIDGYNADTETRGAVRQAYYFANLYSSRPAGHAMLRDPRVKAMLVRVGLPRDDPRFAALVKKMGFAE